jgi:cobyrinic acid a,c-diamide synthase
MIMCDRVLLRHSAIADGAVIEGVMGLFDGAGSSEVASTAQVVKLLNYWFN